MTLNGLALARVIRLYPGYADIVCFDGQRCPAVPIMGSDVSEASGTAGLETPSAPQTESPLSEGLAHTLTAVIGFVARSPVILGFLNPRGTSQMLFDEADRFVKRLASDVYVTGDADGNVELYHPSGTYIRIGEGLAHENLTGRDVNKLWKVTRNRDKTPGLRISIGSGSDEKARINISAGGAVTITAKDVNIEATTVDVTGVVTAKDFKTPEGVSLTTHRHPGVQTGGGTTAPPLPG